MQTGDDEHSTVMDLGGRAGELVQPHAHLAAGNTLHRRVGVQGVAARRQDGYRDDAGALGQAACRLTGDRAGAADQTIGKPAKLASNGFGNGLQT